MAPNDPNNEHGASQPAPRPYEGESPPALSDTSKDRESEDADVAPSSPQASPERIVFAHEVLHQEMIGPLPPPQMVRGYEEALPGAADRLFTMAEKEQSHRHATDERLLELKQQDDRIRARESLIGQILAFLLAVMVIGGGIWLILSDKSAEGLATILSALAVLAGTFLYSRRVQPRTTPVTEDRDDVAQDDVRIPGTDSLPDSEG